MSDLATLEHRIRQLEDLEAIRQLKYRYWRHLDCKEWEALAALFTADATVCYSAGRYEFAGVEAIIGFLRDALGGEHPPVTIHHGQHPEITLTGPDSATGIWALYNYMFNVAQNRAVRIGAYYEDRYVRLGGTWKLQHIGYRPLFHEEWPRDAIPGLKLL